LTVREYFKDGNTTEKALAAKADELWKGWWVGILKERRAILALVLIMVEMNFKLERTMNV
jgi:hypothetical protein